MLLNQTYEPLGTLSVARAIVMTLKDGVFVEEWDGERVLRSASAEFRVPSVIRRRVYINIRRRREQSSMKRLRIYTRDKFRCQGDRTPEAARMPLLTSQTALRVKLERVMLCHYAEARAEWRKYLFMDMYDDRAVMDKVHNEQKGRA